MKSRLRVSRRTLIAASVSLAISLLYLQVGLAPGGLNAKLSSKIGRLTGKRVTFSKALWLPFEGLSLHDLKVEEANGTPLFTAKKFAVNVRLLPFLRDKKIVISDLQLLRPEYELILERPAGPRPAAPPPMTRISGQIAVPVASDEKKIDLSSIEEGPNFFLPENVYLEQISVARGTVRIRLREGAGLVEEVRSINLRLAFQKPPMLTFDGQVELASEPSAVIKTKGAWNLENGQYRFGIRVNADRLPPWMADYQKKHFIKLTRAKLSLEAGLSRADDDRAFFHAKTDLRDAEITANNASYAGRMALEAQGLFNFDTRKFERYTGELELIKVEIDNLSKDIAHLSGISGSVHFEPDLIKVKNARGEYKDLRFSAEATIRSFKDLMLKAEIGTDMEMAQILALIPEDQKKWLKGFEIGGRCLAVTEITGSLRQAAKLRKDYNLVLKDGLVRNTEKKIDATNVFAKVSSRVDGLRVSQARFKVKDKFYSLNLFIPKDPDAQAKIDLGSPDFILDAGFRLRGSGLDIQKAKIDSMGLSARFSGGVSSFADPYLTVKGDAELNLVDLERVLKKSLKDYKGYDLRGKLSGPFVLSGRPADITGADLKLDARSDGILIQRSMRLGSPELQIRANRGTLSIPYIHADFYGGTLSGDMIFDFMRPDTPFMGKLLLLGVDLHALAADLPAGDKRLAGTLDLQTDIRGLAKHADSLTGTASLSVKNGWLFESKEFKQMGNLPLFIRVEGLDAVAFRQAQGNFTIGNKKLVTDNLNLVGDTVDLMLRGDIDFDQTLDMAMEIRYSNDVIRGAYDTGGLVPFIVQNAQGMISEYHVGGTIAKPKYEKMSVPQSVGRKIGGVVKTITS